MMFRRPQCLREQGFTWVEFLVVVAAIAILAALTLGGFRGYPDPSERNRTVTVHAVIKAGLEQYHERHGDYPEPRTPEATIRLASQDIRVGGARTLYQALTGDGDSEIKLTSSRGNVSDGKISDGEMQRVINGELMVMKNCVVTGPDGCYLADGWKRPMQYVKGGASDSINSTYDLWSFGPKGTSNGGGLHDVESRRSVETTARWIKNW
ncbi:prepilin-type N-terminal cleavage/methylation domain-containing protein [Roseimicrobium gellanilyticum]|uniref:Prepilin-type N-terminal cleavage/methylation domain-containing protein n=1 Tax=Roseimicrobium gellanilyticum TaxID=748857 RepID=A0A366HVA3_9BACT|nr:prepilin-type N-terminal cleavage/methylation domain-containing protein [Roseimicrobium gellanilyticum]RBP47790.1 prepilin-type N-terminal cleavage/methylation domain-containing protein [Roseimicrobium gellanilyticum]